MSTEDALAARFDRASSVIKSHNDAIGEGNPGVVDESQVFGCIKAYGGTTPEILKGMSYEDISQCLPSVPGTEGVKPMLLAKEIARVFRDREESESSGPSYVSTKSAKRMTARELVECFDPEDSANPVGKRLMSLSKGKKFIVYESGRSVDTKTTYDNLREIQRGLPEVDKVAVGGTQKRVYAIGELPPDLVDENPLYPGRPLRSGEVCDQTGRSWEGISREAKELVWVAVTGNQKLEVNIEKAHAILDMLLSSDGLTRFKQIYGEAVIEHDEMPVKPQLQVALNAKQKDRRKDGPLSGGRRVQF